MSEAALRWPACTSQTGVLHKVGISTVTLNPPALASNAETADVPDLGHPKTHTASLLGRTKGEDMRSARSANS